MYVIRERERERKLWDKILIINYFGDNNRENPASRWEAAHTRLMGCCASKLSTEESTVILQKTAITGADAGVIAGGAVAGAIIAGPLAPVGAVVGGIIAAAGVGTVGGETLSPL